MPNSDSSDPASPKEILKTIRAGSSRGLRDLSPERTIETAAQEPEEFTLALRGLARRCTPGVEGKRHDTEPILTFLDRIAPSAQNAHVDYLRSTADLYEALADADIASALNSGRIDGLRDAVSDRMAAHPERHGGHGAELAQSNVLGKINSLSDRDIAVQHFHRMRSEDREGIVPAFYADLGAMTYFDEADVSSNETAQEAEQIRSTLREVGEPKSSNRTSIVISVDPRFFRIYAPHLYFCAQQLPEIDVSIVICGTGGQAKELIADGHRYLKALDTLNRSGYPQNLHHYFVPVPKVAVERRTFYAAARFFAAPVLLERYTNLYLMDADLVIDAHPGDFLKRVSTVPVAVPKTTGPAVLSPWRRYMAGNIPLSRAVLDTGFLDDLQRYLAHGIRRRNSWMLDQNALSYAVERFPGGIEDVNDYSRPIRTMRFMSTWEKNQRRMAPPNARPR